MPADREAILSEITGTGAKVSFVLSPKIVNRSIDVREAIENALASPIGCRSLAGLVTPKSRVLLLADDITRPTPRKLLIPPVLDTLNRAGVTDSQVTILIALGTHRAMPQGEIQEAFGSETVDRVPILNHDFRDVSQLCTVGTTKLGTPVIINRLVLEAELTVGIGSIVPHPEAGWSGGAKILQPGVSGERTTAWTHMLAARQPDHLALAGTVDNPVRLEIEQVAQEAGLRFVVNAVFDGAGRIVVIVAGDTVKAHRVGVHSARDIFVQSISEKADIVIVDARPADLDYWQGIKPLAFATRAVKTGGVLILVGAFSDGISPIYETELRTFGQESRSNLRNAEKQGRLDVGVCTEALYLHAAIMEHARVICVSDGLSEEDKASLGFRHARTLAEAVRQARDISDANASVGVIFQGGDVLPRLTS